jgi:nicotinamide-nucleotide amidase
VFATVPPAYAAAVNDRRVLRSAELVSIGSELTVGDTRDTNAGELARDLSIRGVTVGRLTAVPDRLETVRDAFGDGIARADLVVSTGGLGPTPDDLTREAIAAVLGQTPTVDPELETWLRDLWRRRGMEMPAMNLKQAWLIPGGTAIPNENGTAPGWWIDAPNGTVIVALPGPPREMRPMWRDWVLPRLEARGLGGDFVSRTYRLTGIGESAVADQLGEELLRQSNPEVATYARVEAVDVRVSAFADRDRSAAEVLAPAERRVLEVLGSYVWAHNDETWAMAIGRRLQEHSWSLAAVEVATGGALLALLGDQPWLRFGETVADEAVAGLGEHDGDDPQARAIVLARHVRQVGGGDVGVSVSIAAHGSDTVVWPAVSRVGLERAERSVAFLGGQQGRAFAALVTAAFLWRALAPEDRR